MKVNSKKKGFTIVELVIVIAVIGILAAILIPTFVNLTSKAQDQSDLSLIRNLNTQLAIKEIDEGKNKNMTEAVADAREMGFDVAKISPYGGKDIVWDSVSDRFAFSKNNAIVYPTDGTIKGTGAEIWGMYKASPSVQYYSIYAKEGYTHSDNFEYSVGFDAGDVESELPKFSIANDDYTGNLVVYTKNIEQEFSVNAPLAKKVEHFGVGKRLDSAVLNPNSYHEYGNLRQAVLNAGHMVLESGAFVGNLRIKTSDQAATLTLNSGSILGSLFIEANGDNKVTVKSNGTAEIVYLNLANTDANLDIVLANSPKFSNVCDKNDDNNDVSIVNVADDGEQKPLPSNCDDHDWQPENGEIQVCTKCGEVKFTSVDEENNPTEYVEKDDGDGNIEEEEYANLNQEYDFYNSYVPENAHYWVHEISNKDEFKNILVHIQKYGYYTNSEHAGEKDEKNGEYLAYENTVYRIIKNIDFGGSLWDISDNDSEEYALYSTTLFNGVLDGNNMTLSNISMSYNGSTSKTVGCLFAQTYRAEFKNITINNFHLTGEKVKAGGLLIGSAHEDKSKIDTTSFLKFSYITINETCDLSIGQSSAGALAGTGRYQNVLSIENVTNYANIESKDHSVAAFIGGATTTADSPSHVSSKIICKNSYNYGDITSNNSSNGGLVGMVSGQCHGHSSYELENLCNYGRISGLGDKVSPILCVNSSNIPDMLSGGKFTKIENLDNHGTIVRQTNNANDSAFGLHVKNGSDCLVKFNNEVVTSEDFFDLCVVTSSVKSVSFSGTSNTNFDPSTQETQFSINTAALELSAATRIVFSTTVVSWRFDYETNSGPAGSTSTECTRETINIESIEDSYSFPRLGYIGQRYTDKGVPSAVYNGEETHYEDFPYPFTKFLLDNESEYEVGYHKLSDGSAYFIHDTSHAAQDGFYYLTSDRPSWVTYKICIYNGDELVAEGTKVDMQIPSSSGMLNLREIPDLVTVVS